MVSQGNLVRRVWWERQELLDHLEMTAQMVYLDLQDHLDWLVCLEI